MQQSVIGEMRFDNRKASDLPKFDRMQLIHSVGWSLFNGLFTVAIRLKSQIPQLESNAVDEVFADKGSG
ncbi:hypothetical protein LINPERHAP2_LOCUS32029 [Linum perenne]